MYPASIRPRLRSRGDAVSREYGPPVGLTLQFGHGCGAVEIVQATYHNPQPHPRFNSATAAEPWRYHRNGDKSNDSWRFNSATAAEPWRCEAARRRSQPTRRLQFGHGCGAVEIWPYRLPWYLRL